MKVLLTGGAGFLAGAVARVLGARGHELVTVDRRGSVDMVMDLADPAAVGRLPEVDSVIHCAAVQYVAADELPLLGRRDYFFRNNTEVTRLLTERYAGADTHFLNISTSMVYHQSGRKEYGVDSPCLPQGHYSRSKVLAQEYVDAMPNPTATVIPCIIAGEGRGGLFESLLKSIARWKAVVIPGRGDHPIHVVHVEDCASLVALVAEKRLEGRYNAASRDPLSIDRWIAEIEDECGLPPTRRIRLPLGPIALINSLLGEIPIPRERLLMLKYPHVLSVHESLAAGWEPQWTNARIVRQTTKALARKLGMA